ncbi:MAG TPA: MDR family MFS transporter [Nonomuraea sp.]|nr:MDR family MFS transporter [Nonomuraea sp.]
MKSGTPPSSGIDPTLRKLVWVLVFGALAPALDTTIVNVAIDALGRDLHVSVGMSQWTITAYLLAMGMAMPVTKWLSERFGGKQMWLFSLGLFLLGSVLSGLAWDITSLIVFRVVQGAGAGLIMPIVTTLLVQAAGGERLGGVMAIAMLPVIVVPIFGPVVGGLIVNHYDWRWIFYINVPICLLAMFFAARTVPGDRPAKQCRPFDVLGLLLLSPGLALIIYGLSQVTSHKGFGNTAVLVPLAVGLVLVAAFVAHALRRPERALINLRVLRIRSYSSSAAVLFLAGLSVYGPLLLLSLFYQEVQAQTALMTGLLLAPQGVGSLLPRGIAGSLSDRIGPRIVVLTGLALTAIGTIPFALATPDTSNWLLAAALFVRGAGLAPVTIAVMTGAFQHVPENEVADASSTTRLVQQVGGSFGAAVLAVILMNQFIVTEASTAAGRAAAFNVSFWWAIGFTLLAVVPALLLPNTTGRRAEAPQVPA